MRRGALHCLDHAKASEIHNCSVCCPFTCFLKEQLKLLTWCQQPLSRHHPCERWGELSRSKTSLSSCLRRAGIQPHGVQQRPVTFCHPNMLSDEHAWMGLWESYGPSFQAISSSLSPCHLMR
eukprot:739399-Pelagomonas_calceolata.AAC.4